MRTTLALLATLAVAQAAGAQALPCRAAKLQAAGKATFGLLKCHATAAKKGLAADPACLAKATTKLTSAVAAAEAKGGCAPDDGAARLGAVATDAANAAVLRLRPTNAISACQAAKLLAAGKRADATLKAHAKNLRTFDLTKLQPSVTTARAKYDLAVVKAEAKGGCLTTGDGGSVAGAVDAGLDVVMTAVRVVERTTETRPSPVAPAKTPGTPAVVETYPTVQAMLGASPDLNHVTWTRWRLNDVAIAPDAVLIAVPGFGGGAGNFEVLAENLIPRLLEDHGIVAELWGYDRRTEQLEDRDGALLAGQLGDPLVALDWYYGAELSLPLSPQLSRRAVFHNTTTDVPFIANWTSLVFSRDIDVVVAEASAVSGGNVFLAGHSAGTGFAARYAATDFNLSGVGAPDPGYARLRGLVVLEGGGGSTATPALTADALDRMEAKADGALYAAVRDGAGRCVDGTTACTVANETTDCALAASTICTPSVAAHGVILGISPRILASAEPAGVQGVGDPDGGQAIIQADQGAPGNNAVAKVPELALLAILGPGTVDGLFGSFLDDDGVPASLSAALATSVGGPGPVVGGLTTWTATTETLAFPAGLVPNNGAKPTTLPGAVWGTEREVVRLDRLRSSFAGVRGANASDWYYPISGLSTTTAAGLCQAGVCTKGNVGATCSTDANCAMSISLDSTALSVGRGRRDIENLTQAPNVNIPVLAVGGSNGLAPVAGRFTPLAQSLGTCTAPSCDGTPRVVNATTPNPAFPTFGDVAGGFEVVIAEGFAHVDVVAAEDDAANPVVRALGDFIARNAQ